MTTIGLALADTVSAWLRVVHFPKKLQIVMTMLLYDPVINVPAGTGVGGERRNTLFKKY
jgi:hypothetical protein